VRKYPVPTVAVARVLKSPRGTIDQFNSVFKGMKSFQPVVLSAAIVFNASAQNVAGYTLSCKIKSLKSISAVILEMVDSACDPKLRLASSTKPQRIFSLKHTHQFVQYCPEF
jgi:hypothetical protein